MGMPTPQPRPSDFKVGPLQFGGAGGMGNPGLPMGATMPLSGVLPGGGRPMRNQRGMEGLEQAMQNRMGGRMRPKSPTPVGPGGGYKKGGKIDGCATRGMTKGRNK